MDYFSEFKPLLESLKSSVESKDWDQCMLIDEQLRNKVELFASDIKDEPQTKQFELTLKRLQKIVALIQVDAEKHHREIEQELSKLSRDQKVAKSYSAFMELK